MFIKFFSRPKKRNGSKGGSPKLSINYLLKKEDHQVQVLAGDPELAVELAESLIFENRYTVGCLTFEEATIPETYKYEIIQKFEETFFAGLEADQFHITWVEHTDKNRLELNFFIPNVELYTGKRLQPYYDRADRHLAENFKEVINSQYGLSSPDDPQKRQMMTMNMKLPQKSKEAVEALNGLIRDGYEHGEIHNRKDVIGFLEKYGFEIARQAENYISIKNEGGRNIRLKGAFYEQSFGVGGASQTAKRTRKAGKEAFGSSGDGEEARGLSERAEAALASSVEKRKADFSKRFSKRETGAPRGFNGVKGSNRECTEGFSQEIQNSILGTSSGFVHDGDRNGLFYVGSKKPIRADDVVEAIGGGIQGSKQGYYFRELQNARQNNQTMRQDRSSLSGSRMGRRHENISEKGEVDGSGYEALKRSIARFRREAEQRIEVIKREIRQTSELYRKITRRKPDIAEFAREIIEKFRVKMQKNAEREEQENIRFIRGKGLGM